MCCVYMISVHRFDTSKYTWERDRIIVNNSYNQKSLVKFSSTLKTRDFDKHWYRCPNEHLYVHENGEPCATCVLEERREENKRSEGEQLGQNNRSLSRLGENVRKHLMRAPVTDFRVRGRGRGRGRGKGRGRFRGRW